MSLSVAFGLAPLPVAATPVVVVLEGKARAGVQEGVVDGVEVVHARGTGDDALAG